MAGPSGPEDPRLRNLASRRLASSTLLQQLLYYQFFFSWAWIFFWLVWLLDTYGRGLYFKDDDVVRIVLTTFWLVGEPIRLVAGWYGNLQENVPWLVLFCILTLAPVHATIYYIMLASWDTEAVNKAVQVAQALLAAVEFIVGVYAVRKMYKIQRKQYYLFEFAMNERRRHPGPAVPAKS